MAEEIGESGKAGQVTKIGGTGRVGSWRLLLGYVRPYRGVLALGGVLSLVSSLAGLAMPLLAKTVIDAFGEQRSLAGPVVGLTAAVLLGAAVGAFGRYVLERMGEGIVFSARRSLVDGCSGCGSPRSTGSSRVICSPGSPPTPPCCARCSPTGSSSRSARCSCWWARS
ncbi:hypothetical protein [Planomonospora algeriensis]